MEHSLPDNWPLPESYLTELGRISVLFGSLESSVNLAISKLSGYDEIFDWRSAVATAHANFKQRVDILETLCHELHDEHPHLEAYKSVVKKIKDAQAGRNKYMHNSLTFNEELGEIQSSSLSARGQLKPTIVKVSIEEMRDLSANIHMVMLELHYLITKQKYPPIWERNG